MISMLGSPSRCRCLSVSAFRRMETTKKIADASTAYTAHGDHPVIDDDTATSTASRFAVHCLPKRHLFEKRLRAAAVRGMEFWCIKICQPDLYPGARVRRDTHAKSVAVADVAHRAAEMLSGARW